MHNRSFNKTLLTLVAIAVMFFCGWQKAAAQRVSLKTNALYWATASPNIGAELRINRHITFNFEALYNKLHIGSTRTRAEIFNPEMRYWLSARPQAGHFIGIIGAMANYDITHNGTRHNGDALGAGLSYGYSFVLGRHWSLETTVGAGLLARHEKRYGTDGQQQIEQGTHTIYNFAPLKAGVTFVYIIK